MSANPYPSASHGEAMPTMDPRTLPFPPHLAQPHAQYAAMYGSGEDTLAMELPHTEHGPVLTPVTEPAYAMGLDDVAAETPSAAALEAASTMAMPVAPDAVDLHRHRRRVMFGATAVVLVLAAIGFTVAWQVASGGQSAASTSTSSEHTDVTGGGAFEAGTAADAPGGVDVATPPAGAGGPGAPGAGAPAIARPRSGSGTSSAAPASRSEMINPGPGTPMPGMGATPPAVSGSGANPPSDGAAHHPAPAVQPVGGSSAATARPASAAPRPAGSAQRPANGTGPVPVAGAGAGAATPTANPVTTGNVIQPGAAAAAPQAQAPAASATQVIIAVKTTAGTWQMYKTDPRRVALQSNPAGANLQGAMSGVVWLANSWQPAYILAQAAGPGVTGGATATATGGGAPMKR